MNSFNRYGGKCFKKTKLDVQKGTQKIKKNMPKHYKDVTVQRHVFIMMQEKLDFYGIKNGVYFVIFHH